MKYSVNTQNKIRKAIDLEYLRQKLSLEKKYLKLEKLYTSKLGEIPNFNTSIMWGKLNSKDITFLESPMAYDRVVSVSSFIEGSGIKILDVGFGQGKLEELLQKKLLNIELWGVDISSESVKVMKKKYVNTDWKFFVDKISNFKLPKNYFDYIAALEVLEHIEPSNIMLVLKKLYASLKSGGRLIISVPLNEGLEEMLLVGHNPNAHTRIYSPDLIKSELIISGFTIKSEKYIYAFRRQYYLKSLMANLIPGIKKPNGIIVSAIKP